LSEPSGTDPKPQANTASGSAAIDAPDLLPVLRDWIEATTGARVVFAARHYAGASREAWSLEVADGDQRRSLFLLKDKGDGGGSIRDAAVLRVLRGTRVPVPEVVGLSDEPTMLLLERIPGRSDFPGVDDEAEREPTARHLMELTAALHGLDAQSFEIPHLSWPKNAEDCARTSLDQAKGALEALGESADPFFHFALAWLEANIPKNETRLCLVHSDMGPGNFLYSGGRVTGIVDWEVAHYGDPMEDLAAIGVRDMATPIGDLATRFEEYEAASGTIVDLSRVDYFRALVLVRNSLMIGLGLAHPSEGFDVVEMTMFQTLLMRGAALVLCDNLEVGRPSGKEAASDLRIEDEAGASSSTALFLRGMRDDLDRRVTPSEGDETSARAVAGVLRGLAMLEHESRVGTALDRAEYEEIVALLDETDQPRQKTLGIDQRFDVASSLRTELEMQMRNELAGLDSDFQKEREVACYFARRMHRLAERRRPLMGELMERLPQSLRPLGSPTPEVSG
jgi:aminoglycoside phosphotransferase